MVFNIRSFANVLLLCKFNVGNKNKIVQIKLTWFVIFDLEFLRIEYSWLRMDLFRTKYNFSKILFRRENHCFQLGSWYYVNYMVALFFYVNFCYKIYYQIVVTDIERNINSFYSQKNLHFIYNDLLLSFR